MPKAFRPPICPGTMRPMRYAWDGENRLAAVYPTSPGAGSKKLTFAYDYMGRRVQKKVIPRDGENTVWLDDEPEQDQRFVYDGWNVVLVLDGRDGEDPGTEPDNVTIRKYTWGLDMSGLAGARGSAGIHGAGGIGGLLAVEETAATNSPAYWFLYDANGNVGQILNASDQLVAARYEYDPYGNVIGPDVDADGQWTDDATAYALDNPFRFSTKWLDTETGVGYWGKRYLLFRLGRWISRDPIMERGGPHLYAYTSNQAVNAFDARGLSSWGEPTGCDLCLLNVADACQCSSACPGICPPTPCPWDAVYRGPAAYAADSKYCGDTGFTGLLHSGKTCFRGIMSSQGASGSCPPSRHVCFDSAGNCDGHLDVVGWANGKATDGTCTMDCYCAGQHQLLDVMAPKVLQACLCVRNALNR